MTVVVDAAALAKTFLDEEAAPAFRGFVGEAVAEGRTLLAPGLLRYELGNIVAFQFPEAGPDRRAGILEDALALVRTEGLDEPGDVFRFVEEAGSYYDAAYLALAAQEGVDLLTYDGGLADAAEGHGVGAVSPGAAG